jgi:pyruvate dehydrogenase E2 component (dihydrolipoamide acetyltransferase)
MAKAITMPALSPSMTEGTLVKWLKKEGDTVKTGDILAEVETDKATMDLESFDAGTLLKIILPEGSRVAVNGKIAVIGQPGEKIDESLLAPPAPAPAPAPAAPAASVPAAETPASAPVQTAPAPAPTPVPVSTAPGARVRISPLARKIAAERGVQVANIIGTGPGGRIVKRDVLAAPVGGGGTGGYLGAGPVAREERLPLSNMRRTIAKRLLDSKTQIPHFYLEVEVDAANLVQTRVALNTAFEAAGKKLKLSLNDFVLKACTEAIRRVPAINASFEGDAIRQYGSVHMSFAVAIPDGLITPVIRDAHAKSLMAIGEEAKSLGIRAKEGKLKPEEYTGGTFTVSNLGMMGIDRFSAIINPPQAAILAVGNVVKKPVVNAHDQIVIGQRMSVTLSCDHRVVDGAVGALFLKEFRTLIENPALLLV